MRVFAKQLFAVVLLPSLLGSGCLGLRCYQCSWSNNPIEFASDQFAAKDDGFRHGNPVAKPYIGGKVTRPPNATEVRSLCDHTTCSDSHNSCLKWTFLSSSPINITYMCVRSSKQQHGCYRQDVQIKDVKQHLRLEACLCRSNFCNIAVTSRLSVILHCIAMLLNLAILKYF